jgi:hypothetical protein
MNHILSSAMNLKVISNIIPFLLGKIRDLRYSVIGLKSKKCFKLNLTLLVSFKVLTKCLFISLLERHMTSDVNGSAWFDLKLKSSQAIKKSSQTKPNHKADGTNETDGINYNLFI